MGGVEDVVSVLTLVRRGVAQVFHVLRVEELREQFEVEEEEEGKENGQEEEEEVESGEGRVKERQPPHTWMTWRWRCEQRSELEPRDVSVRQSTTVERCVQAQCCCDAPRDRRSALCQRRHWCSHCCALCPACCCTRRSN